MIRLSTFSDLINKYPILDHTVSFNHIGYEWQMLLSQYPDLEPIFESIQNDDGTYSISRGDVFNEQEIRTKVIKALIWGFPSGYQGKQNLSRIISNMNRIIDVIGNLPNDCSDVQLLSIFRAMKNIPGLGFSSITKLLYFFNVTINGIPAVIVDLNVKRALPHVNFRAQCPLDMSPDSYIQQVRWMSRVSASLHIDRPDKLEYFLFCYGKSI